MRPDGNSLLVARDAKTRRIEGACKSPKYANRQVPRGGLDAQHTVQVDQMRRPMPCLFTHFAGGCHSDPPQIQTEKVNKVRMSRHSNGSTGIVLDTANSIDSC